MIQTTATSIALDGLKFIAGSLVGALITKRVEGKTKLVSHWGSISAFTIRAPNSVPTTINTHEIVVGNAGAKAATNVRITHAVLPDQVNVNPPVPYTVEELPGGQKDIVIPTLVAKQYITLSYLYFPPLTFSQIHAGIRCNEGFATTVEMSYAPKSPKWATVLVAVGFGIGCVTLLYLAWRGLQALGG